MKRGRTNHVIPKQPLRARESCDRPHQFKTNQSIRLSSPRVVNKRERERERERDKNNKQKSIADFLVRNTSRISERQRTQRNTKQKKKKTKESRILPNFEECSKLPLSTLPPPPTPHTPQPPPTPSSSPSPSLRLPSTLRES